MQIYSGVSFHIAMRFQDIFRHNEKYIDIKGWNKYRNSFWYEPFGWGGFFGILVLNVKAGRNDPCPCGSGKKYKKCCGRNADGG